jgi:hypothetical protein
MPVTQIVASTEKHDKECLVNIRKREEKYLTAIL